MDKFLEENNIEVLDVWVAWSNSDKTEGKGYPIPLHTCYSESTAVRLGKNKSVMGSNCNVTKEKALKIKNKTYIVGRIEFSSDNDKRIDKDNKIKSDLVCKAKSLGFTDEETKYLGK